jgi:ferredoxin-type protein NapG
MASESQYGRRQFLKDSVISVAKAAHEFVKHKEAPREKAETPPRTDWLRPPGAVEEGLFLERCTRCGDCAKVCPYGSIGFDQRDGTPVVFPDQVPCYLCEDFPCIAACATDALSSVARREEVRMGQAVVSHRDCTAGQGCHACVSKCPMGALEMDFESMRLMVTIDRCVGCGICESVCKTVNDRIAIKVSPERWVAKGRSHAGL